MIYAKIKKNAFKKILSEIGLKPDVFPSIYQYTNFEIRFLISFVVY